MVYLIESTDSYKIGYTIDLSGRIKQYNTHNPVIMVLDIIEGGTQYEESQLKSLLSEYNIKGEWFEKVPEVLKIWKHYKDSFKKEKTSEYSIEMQKIYDRYMNDVKDIKENCNNLRIAAEKQYALLKYAFKLVDRYSTIIKVLCRKILNGDSTLKSFAESILDGLNKTEEYNLLEEF